MRTKTLLATAAVAAAVTLAGAQARAQNLLTNGSFETGDFAGWTFSGSSSFVYIEQNSTDAEDGGYFLNNGGSGSERQLSQTFADTAGGTLTLSGWMYGCACSSGESYVRFLFNGVELFNTGSPFLGNPGPWVNETVTALATGHDTFTIAFRQDPGYSRLDNFSVTESPAGGAVPEPAAWALMLTGFLGAGGALRRRRAAAAAA